jgi:hypothetical protein
MKWFNGGSANAEKNTRNIYILNHSLGVKVTKMCKACEFKDFLVADLEQLAYDNPYDWLETNLKKFLEGVTISPKESKEMESEDE